MPRATQWFVKRDKEITGPFSSSTLRTMVGRGEVKSITEVAQTADGPWYPAAKVRGLIPDSVADEVPSMVEESLFEERNPLIDAEAWKKEIQAISWKDLFPLASWFRDQPWTLVWVQTLVFTFATPFLMLQLFSDGDMTLTKVAWSFSTYFAMLWAIFLHRLLKPRDISGSQLFGLWMFTSTIGVLAVIVVSVVGKLIPGLDVAIEASQADVSAGVLMRLFGMTIGVGLIEESAKLFPVLWIVRRMKGREVSMNTVVFLGVISGLAFGATEAIVYSYRYVESLALSQISAEGFITVQILRFISLPLLHAVWCGISSYFLALSRISQHGDRVLIAVGVATSMILHGSYNTFADSWVGFGITILSLFLFVGYIRTGPMSVLKPGESSVNSQDT